MNKEQLIKLASLDNAKTNQFLKDFALQEQGKITSAKTNDEIIEHLEILEAIYYRAPEVVVWVINYLLHKAKNLPIVDKKIGTHKIPGTSHEEVVAKCLELAKSVRYYDIDKTIQIAFDYMNHKNKVISGSALKLIEELVDYNHQILPKIGITPQLKAMEFLENKLRLQNPNEHDLYFIKTVTQHILETSSNISRMTSPDTLTFSSGDISGHKNIGKIRRRAINFILDLFKNLTLVQNKIAVFPLFEQACQMPMNSSRDSDLGKMIQKDRQYIAQQLTMLIFSGKNVIKPLVICMHAEHLMHWHFIHIELQQELGSSFIKRLYKDNRYKLFSEFVHDDSYRYAKYKDIKKNVSVAIHTYIENVSAQNKDFILKELNDIASEAKNTDEWKFLSFKQLLEKLGQEKPNIVLGLIKDIAETKNDLSSTYFLPFLLAGLRRANRFDLWDQASDIILNLKDETTMCGLVSSIHMNPNGDTDLIIRPKEDIAFLSDLVKRTNKFSFYKEYKNLLSFFTINALRVAYKFDPVNVEELTVLELRNNPDYFTVYMHNISLYSRKGEGFNLSGWSAKDKTFLIEGIIKLPDLDWQVQSILPLICSPKNLVSFFIKRIKFRDKMLSSSEDYFESPYRRYDPVPYHMNEELVSFMTSDPGIIASIAKKLSPNYTVDSIELSQLIKNLNLDPRNILNELSKGKEDTDTVLRKVVRSLSHIDANDPDFLVELAGKTSNKSIHDSIYGKLASTGVVSGEFGIADAYKRKRESIEKHKDSKNKNIKKFVLMAMVYLKNSEEHQRKEAEQEKEIRRIDFESNN
ncbi:MAG: hypothetical protein WC847_00140 [Candidatus Paceibacterota bacterium]|jgi:hypothetical protein